MSKPIEFLGHPWSLTKHPPVYRAVCKRILDGDTYEFFIDFGLRQYGYITVRLEGLDTPELFHPRNDLEKGHAILAKQCAMALLLDEQCIITTHADDITYGRYVAKVEVLLEDRWTSVAEILSAAGFAKRDSY